MDELNSGVLSEPVELPKTELDLIAGGRATAFVRQSNSARVAIGNGASVSTGSGSSYVYIGDYNAVTISQSNTNSGAVSATNS